MMSQPTLSARQVRLDGFAYSTTAPERTAATQRAEHYVQLADQARGAGR